ncbi:MAG: hypothetical protein R3358_00700 [Woeseiaceae bacterium]|nr:hypothetical protein [Woeseiaceae bacterium]
MSEIPFATICVSGDDAGEFLQNQLTADLRALEPGQHLLSAWCNPKGRVICLFRVRRLDDAYALTLPAELAEPVVKRLTMFRFRARVEFELREADAAELGIDGDLDAWRLDNLRAGIPEIGQQQSEQFTAHMLNLDLSGAVSLDKGCYPGQEIIARTHYRGASRRRLARFDSDAPLTPCDKLEHEGRAVGEVVNAIGNELLAVVPADLADARLSAGGVSLTPRPMTPR